MNLHNASCSQATEPPSCSQATEVLAAVEKLLCKHSEEEQPKFDILSVIEKLVSESTPVSSQNSTLTLPQQQSKALISPDVPAASFLLY